MLSTSTTSLEGAIRSLVPSVKRDTRFTGTFGVRYSQVPVFLWV